MGLADKLKNSSGLKWKLRPEVLRCDQLPLPLHGMAPRVILGKAWWDETRKAAYTSTGYHCIACGEAPSQPLEAHELYEIDHLLGRSTYIETVPICKLCHLFIHRGLLAVLKVEGVVSVADARHILSRGIKLLADAGLKVEPPYRGPSVEWNEWRLVINGVEHPPVLADFQAYQERYGA